MSTPNPDSFSFSMNITASESTITIPRKLDFLVKKVRITSVSYTTADTNTSYFMLIHLPRFDSKRLHINTVPGNPLAVSATPYCLKVPLNAQSQSQNIYVNRYDSYDAVSVEGEKIQALDVVITINGVFSSLISPSNPVYLEVLLSS